MKSGSTVKEDVYVLYLDRYHLGDDLFLKELAQRFHQAPPGEPSCMIVHGSGEKVERTLESRGLFPDRKDGILDVQEPEHVRLVERAVRETNRKLVALLTDEVVPTVGVQGVDRSLLQMDAEGILQAPRTGWVEALIKQRVVPVVSALVDHPEEGRVREVCTADAVVALARSLDEFETTVTFFTKSGRAGLANALETKPSISVDTLAKYEDLPEPDAVQHIALAGVNVLVTSLDGLFGEGKPRGTHLTT